MRYFAIALILIFSLTAKEVNAMEKEVYFSYRKGDDVKKVSPDSKLIPLLEADGWKAEVHDQPQAPKGRQKKKELNTEFEGEE